MIAARVRTIGLLVALFAGLPFLSGCNLQYHYPSADDDSTSYVTESLEGFAVMGWDLPAFAPLESDEFKNRTSSADMAKLFDFLRRKLGAVKSYKIAKSDEGVSTGLLGETTYANFLVNAQCAKGSAQLAISVINHGKGWKIAGLHVQSDEFLK